MTIIIISGEPGTGKTYQCMGWEEPILYIDLEDRAKKTFERYYNGKIIDIKQCMAYSKDFKEDHITTLLNFERECKGLKNTATLVIDGISELRDYASTKWARDNKRKRPMNPGDWEQINDIVREILFPLINQCRIEGVNLIMTSQFKDDYALDSEGKSSKVGRIPALKEWMAYNVDVLLTLENNKSKYKLVCNKSIAGYFEEIITDKSIYQILTEYGV